MSGVVLEGAPGILKVLCKKPGTNLRRKPRETYEGIQEVHLEEFPEKPSNYFLSEYFKQFLE